MKRQRYLLKFFIVVFSAIILFFQLNITHADENRSNSTVTMVYNPSVEVKYVDEGGKDLKESLKIEGEEGKPFEVKAEAINGYVLKETKGNSKGIFGKDFNVTFVYKLNNVSGSGNKNNSNVNPNNSTNKSLIPNSNQIIDGVKTGDYYENILIIVFIGMIFGIARILYKRKNITKK